MEFYDAPGNPDPSKNTDYPNIKKLSATVRVRVGDKLDIYVKLFDSNNEWDKVMTGQASKINWILSPESAALTKDGAHGVFHSDVPGTYTVTAIYTDGSLVITKHITIIVRPGDAYYLEIVTDSTKINYGRESNAAYLSNTKEFAFKKEMNDVVFYAVLRDAYGYYVGMADSAAWESSVPKSITVEPRGDGASILASSAVVSKHGTVFSDNLYVTAQTAVINSNGKTITITGRVHITVVGESSVAVAPNPFVIGASPPIMERLRQIGAVGDKLENTYRPIVAASKSGGGNGNAENVTGILVVVTAPRPVRTKGNGNGVMYVTDAKAVIYDAVGRVVFRSRPGDLVAPDGDNNTLGFVWDCKNTKGKKAGPGTYAAQITATMNNGEKFVVQRMLGVKLIED
jgi:hypothetical protein